MASSLVFQIEPFLVTGNNITNKWTKWKNGFDEFLVANDFEDATNKRKLAIFKRVCGKDLVDIYDEFGEGFQSADEPAFATVLAKFDTHFADNSNEIFASYQFWNISLQQQDGESFDEFYRKVQEASVDCNFGASLSRNIRDKLIIGIQNCVLREKFLREKTIDEKSVVSQCRISEKSHTRSLCMATSSLNLKQEPQIDVLRKKDVGNSGRLKEFQCNNCGTTHVPRKCPAFGHKCHSCGKMNHWQKLCRKNQQRTVLELAEYPMDQHSSDHYYIQELVVGTLGTSETDWFADVLFNNIYTVNCKLDTGAQTNVISQQRLAKLKDCLPEVFPTNNVLRAFGGSKIDVSGICYLDVKLNGVTQRLCFFISTVDTKTIIGFAACKRFNLIKDISTISSQDHQILLQKYIDVFEGSGCLKTVSITLAENAEPHIAAPRKIPLALYKPVQDELERMCQEGIITKVTEPTDWVSNMHVILKKENIRIVLDPRPLNKFIKRPHFHIPTADELFSKLSGCKFFTVFDAKSAFWQQPLDEESSFLTTFITPFGRYRFLKVPYGLVNAPEAFQSTMTEIFKDIPEITPYFDDIVIGSKTMEEHLTLVEKVLQTARINNLKFSKEKVQLAKTEIAYLGQKITSEGVLPMNSKVQAIVEYPTPSNVDQLNRFLAMYKYHSKHIENSSHKTHPLRQLLKKNTSWLWDENTNKCFNNLKEELLKAPILQIFDSQKQLVLSVDASGYGLGATLSQHGKPVAFASASLTPTQQRYAQIEKEMLAVVFGLQHFHFYTFGRRVIVETDHKPLIGLKEKPLDSISPRLQRMLIKVLQYDFTLQYIPGKELIVADTLSRSPIGSGFHFNCTDNDATNVLDVCVLVTASSHRWNSLKQNTENDLVLQDVSSYILNGWPANIKDVKSTAKPFWHHRESLYIAEGIICKGKQIVIPKLSKKQILDTLHNDHDKIPATKTKAREFFFWLGMDDDIVNVINQCELCQKYQRSNQKEPMQERELPTRPWEKIGVDFFHLRGRDFLLIIDYFSKYVELEEMKHSTAYEFVYGKMKQIFSRHGYPDELISDRGPPFNSRKFADMMKSYDIYHNSSTPRYPKSNGQVERTVQSIKISMEKAFDSGNDMFDVILNHNSTPHNKLPSPAELLFGRRIKAKNIMHSDLLKPSFPIEHIQKQLKLNQSTQKYYYDRHAKQLSDCQIGDNIWFQQQPRSHWQKGQITSANNQTRSYTVKAEGGRQYVRNRVFIRPNNSTNPNQRGNVDLTVEDYYSPILNPTQQNADDIIDELPGDSDSSFQSIPEEFDGFEQRAQHLLEPTPELDGNQQPVTPNQQEEQQTLNDEEIPTADDRPKRLVKIPSKLNDFVLN